MRRISFRRIAAWGLCLSTALGALSAETPSFAQAPPAADPQVTMPRPTNYVPPEYTKEAEDRGIEGTVVLQLDISKEGDVLKAVVVGPLGYGLDETALDAAKKLKFEPARRADGTAFAARILYKYTFALKPVIDPGQPAGPGNTPAGPVQNFKGAILSSEGEVPMPGARVLVKSAKGAALEMTSNAEGQFTFSDLAPGTYVVTVSVPGYEPLSVEEEIEAGQSTEVKYRLLPKAEGGTIDVLVRGAKPPREVTRRTLEQREIARIPGTNGDAIRSITNLPGVARPPAIAGLLIVRGSAPQDTQTFIDGTFVPIIYHFGGLSSVVPTEMLEKIDFYPGNFSAQYGRVMGGIVDVNLRAPKDDGELHGLAQVDLIDARVLAEKSFKIGKYPIKLAAAGRRSYIDAWLGPVLTGVGAGVTQAPVYYDYQFLAETNPTPNSSLRLGFFGSDDALALLVRDPAPGDPGLSGNVGLHTGFQRLQARYENQYSDKDSLSTVVAYGHDDIDFGIASFYFLLDVNTVTGRLEYTHRFSNAVKLNTGFDIYRAFYTVSFRLPPFPRPGEPPGQPFSTQQARDFSSSGEVFYPAAYVEMELTPFKNLKLVPGLRVDYFSLNDHVDISPRVNGRVDIRSGFPRTTVKGGVGMFTQPPNFNEISEPFGNAKLISNRAMQYALGIEQEVTKQVEVSVEGFYKQLDNLVLAFNSQTNTQRLFSNAGTGTVFGSEILLKYKPDDRFFGWLAYTLSRSARVDGPGATERLAPFDQTHILTVLGSYRLGGGWEFGARFRLVSGNLVTPNVCQPGQGGSTVQLVTGPDGNPTLANVPNCDPNRTNSLYHAPSGTYTPIPFSGPATERLPMFNQLDLRIDKRWKMKSWSLSAYLDVQNVYNSQNAEAISYNFNYTNRSFVTGLPILPSIGLRGEM